MSRTKKRILGFLGLVLVLAATIFAAVLPTPGAEATSSFTDTLVVRVVGSVPNVNITGIINDKVYTSLDRAFAVSFENVAHLTVSLQYTNLEGEVTNLLLDEEHPDYVAGEEEYYIKVVK